MTRTDFIDLFPTTADAIAFEEQVLSIGREYLPECAHAVLDGGEANSDYWTFLASQIEEC